MSTYCKDHRVSVFFHLVCKLKLYLLQIYTSCTWFLKVSATFRMTVEDVELGFTVVCLCPGATGSIGRCIWSSLTFPCISSYSVSDIMEGSAHTVLLAPCFPPLLLSSCQWCWVLAFCGYFCSSLVKLSKSPHRVKCGLGSMQTPSQWFLTGETNGLEQPRKSMTCSAPTPPTILILLRLLLKEYQVSCLIQMTYCILELLSNFIHFYEISLLEAEISANS